MKIQKRKISKESVKISSWRSFENEEFKKVKRREKGVQEKEFKNFKMIKKMWWLKFYKTNLKKIFGDLKRIKQLITTLKRI